MKAPPHLTALDRRRFLKSASIALAATGVRARPAWSMPLVSAADLVTGKDPRLAIHTARPAVFETPAALLAAEQVTPLPLVFVRNSQQPADAATLAAAKLAGWKIELAALVENPQAFDAAVLADLPQVEREMVLQCSGNSRSLFAHSVVTKGTPWGRGGMANVRFAGVPLAAVLERFGLKIKPEAKYLTAEGRDDPAPGEQDFEHSIPLAEALKKSLLALRMNGQPLPAIHGGPVRLVTPGFYGTMHVKWLSSLRFEAGESEHTSQVPHYRTPLEPIAPGQKFTATLANSEPNWRMKIKCVVLSPGPDATLSAGSTTFQGVAFNDGEARIAKVLVSPDAGRTWQAAELDVPASPYAWYRWHAALKLPPGKQQVWAMAIDELGRGQPMDGAIHWNPQGYTWNGVEKISVTVG